MQDFLVAVLIGFSSLLGVEKIPKDTGIWKTDGIWSPAPEGWTFKATTENIQDICSENQSIVLPQVIHGIHRVYADDSLVFQSGDNSFSSTSSFYERGIISCRYLSAARSITWDVTTYSEYFARLKSMPKTAANNNMYFFFDVIINIAAGSCLLIMAFFSFLIFRGRIENRYIWSLGCGALAFAVYSFLSSGNYLGVGMSMLLTHKIADVAVWIGSFCYVYFFRSFKVLGRIEFFSFSLAFAIGETLIIFGKSADVVQLGTTIPIPFAFICLISFITHSVYLGFKLGFNKNNVLGIISLTSFVIAGCNDLMHILGLADTFMFMPLGAVFGVFFLAVAVNEEIEKTYQQRDDLVANLQSKVSEQTRHLSEALDQVKKSQVDLVQSARLASLGTLSAGIAHEINNAINYVNGAVIPLERKVMKVIPDADRQIVEKLFGAIKEGTNLTVEIVRSLRNFTGLNQAKVKDVKVLDTVNSVLTILKSKISHIKVTVDIVPELFINCYQVGLNQIFMNLISNAVDVLPSDGGQINISGHILADGNLEIRVSDNGCGMTDAVKNRIFDPFFTTKDVGKGTGLGLHIVQKEVERHAGKIFVESAVGKGTTFKIQIPINLESSSIGEAA
ncbi:MAG: hypothetical protein A2622_07945 [Bdellovibrionales bacterium RIFCSPHIGHO2_01_FULL_40_29]|nr:MAG: hypothetical protein A2622_07945 [Bdellovibrionales bacterium RIFCSPHIGHO2_01_FULL_40_29]OFZ33035.1 MAG: hypothetical protein A3D17_07920 [Bdellovibrionales bacterium RIFCSPHIGHO2_02_FULL_40_15]